MTPGEFIGKWSDSKLRERAGAQSHFIDLCKVLGEKAPTDADPEGEWYAFEKGAMKTGGGDGWADVWKRGCFAWEYKSPGKDLNAALKQLQYYVRSLENPPLLIVSDMERIELHTNWTNTVQEVHTLTLEQLADARLRQKLKWAFSEADVNELKPGQTREALTKEVAQEFVKLAQNLRDRGHDPEKVAHFVNRMVFCMFAEDVDLLPDKLFKRMLEASAEEPESFAENAQKLFAAMAKQGGRLDFKRIEWFNGGIFDDDAALPLTKADIKTALAAANRNWSNIDPSIMGTLFERGLDPGKRSQLGAHYTDPDKIMLIVNPVIVEPLTREWEEKRAEIEKKIEQSRSARSPAARTRAFNEAATLKAEFIERLKNFRVLDPACGSGNFLYLALKELKNIEHRVNVECEQMGLARGFPVVGPECVKGIEINPFAAELARVSVWIGEIQWMREHGFDASRNPILKPLETIGCRDALLNEDGTETEWPEADVIIGNPPFLHSRDLIPELGEPYAKALRGIYGERVADECDFVCYWFCKADDALECEDTSLVGLVSTNSLPRGRSRVVLDQIAKRHRIFDAWTDEPWTVAPRTSEPDKTSVRVSITSFGRPTHNTSTLNGNPVDSIGPDLAERNTDSGFRVEDIVRLDENIGWANQGIIPRSEVKKSVKKARGLPDASFFLEGDSATQVLLVKGNPNQRLNSDVLRLYIIGEDIIDRPQPRFLVDFTGLQEDEAAQFEKPFASIRSVKAHRASMNQPEALERWWLPWNNRDRLRRQLSLVQQYIATPRNGKHRVFTIVPSMVLPDCEVVAIPKEDFVTFGVLQSRFHEAWSARTCSYYGVANTPRYSHKATFETFPFPEGLTPDIPAADYVKDTRAKAIAAAASKLNELRENWLNPPDLVQRVPEVVPTAEQREAGAENIYPDRILPVDDNAAAILKKRTLTNLYNERPAWLDNAHRDLDAAVAAAYGWPADLSDEQILERLFELNQERAAAAK